MADSEAAPDLDHARSFSLNFWDWTRVEGNSVVRRCSELPLCDHDKLASRVVKVLTEIEFFQNTRFKNFALGVHLHESWAPMSGPCVTPVKDCLHVDKQAQWEECGYLTTAEVTDFCTAIAAEALLSVCNRYLLPSLPAELLAKKYPRRIIESSALLYEPTISMHEPDSAYRNADLTADEFVFANTGYRAELIWPLTDKKLEAITSDRLNVELCVDEPYYADDFVRVANALLRAPFAKLKLWGMGATQYRFKAAGYFKYLRRIQIEAPLDLISLAALSPDLLLMDLIPPITEPREMHFLRVFNALQWLGLSGRVDFSVCPNLRTVKVLALTHASMSALKTMNALTSLQSLRILNSTIKNVNPLIRIPTIKYLQIENARVSSLDAIGQLANLEYLNLTNLTALQQLPDMSALQGLRRVSLTSLKRIDDLSPIAAIPNLEHVLVYDMRHLNVEHFRCFAGHPTLKGIWTEFGPKKDAAIMDLVGRTGAGARNQFVFRKDP